jgi:hypothetical protein
VIVNPIPTLIYHQMFTYLSLLNIFQVMEKYSVPDYKDVNEFLTHLGKRQGRLKKGEMIN